MYLNPTFPSFKKVNKMKHPSLTTVTVFLAIFIMTKHFTVLLSHFTRFVLQVERTAC